MMMTKWRVIHVGLSMNADVRLVLFVRNDDTGHECSIDIPANYCDDAVLLRAYAEEQMRRLTIIGRDLADKIPQFINAPLLDNRYRGIGK